MSSTKKILAPYPILDRASMATNQTSLETNVAAYDFGILDIEWSGSTPVGNINVEMLKIPADRNVTNKVDEWEVLNFTGSAGGENIPVTGNTGTHSIVFNKFPSTKIHVKYLATSGTGTITAIISGKEQ